MKFDDLLAACKVLPAPMRADAENDLRAQRVWRLLIWAPTKRGKSTLLRGLASTLPAPLRILSIDSDQVDGPGIERCSLPGFNSQATFQAFCRAFDAQLSPCESRLKSGELAGVGLDTLTTIGTALESLGDTASMLTESQMESQRRLGAQSRVLVKLAGAIAGMHGAAMRSPLDGPIVLAVTEHARMLKDPATFAFTGWCPRIGSNGGERVVSLFDAVFAVGLEPPHQTEALRYAIVWTGRADVGVRLSDAEREVWSECMSMRDKGRPDPTRVGVALSRIWDMRKVGWVTRWLAPHVQMDSKDPEAVLAAALAEVATPAEGDAASSSAVQPDASALAKRRRQS